MLVQPTAIALVRRHRGRPALQTTTPMGHFLVEHMQAVGMSRAAFAERLHISQGTLSRLLRGQTTGARRVTESAICEALGLNGVKRREFLRLARQAGALALTAGMALPAQSRTAHLDLDLLNDRIEEMHRLVALGEPQTVMTHAQRWYDALAASALKPSDPRGAEAKVRVGLVLGAAQEAALPWYQRAPMVLRTYQRAEKEAILSLPLGRMELLHAILVERIAPLYRELGEYHTSLLRFSDGIEYARDDRDPQLRINLYRNRAHIAAVQGDERRWRRDLDAARAIAERAPCATRDMLLGLVHYSEGEGYNRLAYHPHAANVRQRARYAELALRSLAAARRQTGGLRAAQWLLPEVAEVQCLIWLDPVEAVRRGQELTAAVRQFMPGMIDKLERTMRHAQQRLAAASGADVPLFSLDHRGR